MKRRKYLKMGVTVGVLFLTVASIFIGNSKKNKQLISSGHVSEPCVVIDAGHGGDDPGKVGINKALEKDINLQIAFKIKEYLEANDINVYMTRDSDAGLYEPNARNKKVQDMKRRVEILTDYQPIITVSIHQNSYPEEYVHGAQVFYYKDSTKSKELAQIIQQRLRELNTDQNREIKANNSYYLLKKTTLPIVIVECGFLSNKEEAALLVTEEYQQRLAWKIGMGMIQYLNEEK